MCPKGPPAGEAGVFRNMKEVYLDNAAATPVGPAALKAIQKASLLVGNPSSLHGAGRKAADELRRSRQAVATFLNARPEHIVFTSSGSEANTMAVLRLAEAYPTKKHIVTIPVEHKSVLQPCEALKRKGWKVTIVPVDSDGRVDPEKVIAAVRKDTLLVSVMYANNEIGTIEPVAAIGRALRRLRAKQGSMFPLLHTDACQAATYLPMDVQVLNVDLLTLNSSKVYGPRGVGALYIKSGIELEPHVYGGPHERGIRAGTENVPAIAGFAAALKEIRIADGKKIQKLRDWTIERLKAVLPDMKVNGPVGQERFANNINISIPGVMAEQMVLELDRHGIRVGAGAACTSHETGPSHVLKAIGLKKPYVDGVIRVSLSKHTTKSDTERLLEVLPKAVEKVRKRNQR